MQTVELIREYREGILECVHVGMICISGNDGIQEHLGDPKWTCFYRSASKPIQALPVIMMGLDKKYGLTMEERTILSGSHYADEEHVRILESIMKKADIQEDELIMLPTYPIRESRRRELIAAGMPPRKVYHNCAGKHLGMILASRELGDREQDYWRPGSTVQGEIKRILSVMTDVPADSIQMGVDGCGVPVYAVPFDRIARSYARLVCPKNIRDDGIAEAVAENLNGIHTYPNMISGHDSVCSIICANRDMIAKGGAQGVYAIGIRSLGVGVVVKVLDGIQEESPYIAEAVLRQLGITGETVDALPAINPMTIVNDNKVHVGRKEIAFQLKMAH